jgi:hypothetical protein
MLSACAGGGSAATSAPTATKAKPTGTAHFTLTIPKRTAATAKRRAQYVSASTQAVLFTVNPGNLQTEINLTPSNCTTNPAGTANVCTLAVAAPIGTDTFAMVAYDQPFNADGTQPEGTQALSAASNFTVTIAEGQANVTTPLISGGIPSTLAVSVNGASSTTLNGGAASTTPVTVTVYDADNNIIVAPGSFVDASGNPAPVTLTSLAASSGFAYAVTPAGSTVAGTPGGTITLNEPDDRVSLAYNGSAYVPPFDELTHTLPANVGGGTITRLTFGWRVTPPFAPTLLLAPPASISSTIGHAGIVIANSTNTVGFVGDVTSSCVVPPAGSGAVSHIGGITFNAGESDSHVYLWVNDSSQSSGMNFDAIDIASIIGNVCTLTGSTSSSISGTALGTAAAGNDAYAVITSSGADYVQEYSLPTITSEEANVIDGGVSFGTQAVNVSPSGANGYIQFGEKKHVDSIPFGSANGSEVALAGITDPYPGGLTVDTSGNVYANDTTSATYGSNGGIDVFSSSLTETNHIQLASPLVQSGPTGALQNIAIGPYGTSSAVYAVTSAGIEVFAFPLAASVATPTLTIATPASPVSVVTCADGREWVLLSDGTLDALPPN